MEDSRAQKTKPNSDKRHYLKTRSTKEVWYHITNLGGGGGGGHVFPKIKICLVTNPTPNDVIKILLILLL